MNQKIFGLLLAVILLFETIGCSPGKQVNQQQPIEEKSIHFVDDMGEAIALDQPCKKIISLYSAHTENLFYLGLDEEIIGVGTSDIYPVQALEKAVYDYKSDPEKVIAAEPDLVLIRPFINRKNPEFVEAIKRVGIPVVSLYPEKFEDFDDYIKKLGLLTGKEMAAEEKLQHFYEQIDIISEITEGIQPKKKVYFESTENKYRTVTIDSMPALAIQFAGGINIASDVEPITEGSSIAAYGIERILEHAEEIDVYVSQRGAMNSGGNYHSIVIRPGFDTIKAVREDKVFTINQKIISSPTFRYYKGICEVARYMYPEIMDQLDQYYNDQPLSRSHLAEIVVKYMHKPIFIPSSSRYYKEEHEGHTYGFFKDVSYTDESFDYIETAVISGWMDEHKIGGEEYFHPSQIVTKDELAKTIYMMLDFKRVDQSIPIKDIESAQNKKMIQILVDNGVLNCSDGQFYPEQEVTGQFVIDILKKISE